MTNTDPATEQAFDDKWGARWAGRADPAHARRMFDTFFGLFPWDELGSAEGFDLGSGNGRHARYVAPRVGKLHCIDPSANGIATARRAMAALGHVEFHQAGVDAIPLADGSQGFGYSMGVLHHIPDTEAALRQCVRKLRSGAPFLLYLYYAFDNRPWWFRGVWRASDYIRRGIVRLPFRAKKRVTDAIALGVYWPLSRTAGLLERAGLPVGAIPLSFYRRTPLPNLKVSSLDRFGTDLEQRFTRAEMDAMMRRCGLTDIRFQETEPYWVALGRKA